MDGPGENAPRRDSPTSSGAGDSRFVIDSETLMYHWRVRPAPSSMVFRMDFDSRIITVKVFLAPWQRYYDEYDHCRFSQRKILRDLHLSFLRYKSDLQRARERNPELAEAPAPPPVIHMLSWKTDLWGFTYQAPGDPPKPTYFPIYDSPPPTEFELITPLPLSFE